MSHPQRLRLPWTHSTTDVADVRPLTGDDVGRLRLGWQSRFTATSLTAHLRRYPDAGWWLPSSGEYAVGEPWRRRDEIVGLLEIGARGAGRAALLTTAAASARAAGRRLLILPEADWSPHSAPGDAGFAPLERVVYYQLSGLTGPPAPTRPLPPLEFAPLTGHNLATVLALDHAAFPWLWWNSEAEVRAYSGYAGVQLWLGWTAGVPVAYAGFTTLDRWGHLDRLATDPAWQGRGYGAAMLVYALGRMAALGVARVTLSTQATNTGSQRLYAGFGFRRTQEVYDIYGQWLDATGPPT